MSMGVILMDDKKLEAAAHRVESLVLEGLKTDQLFPATACFSEDQLKGIVSIAVTAAAALIRDLGA